MFLSLQATSLLQPRSCGPALRAQPLSINSTLMKWEAPVPLETRAAAAGLLAQLVQLPHLREAASDRLAASRLAALINSTMQQLAAAPGEGLHMSHVDTADTHLFCRAPG